MGFESQSSLVCLEAVFEIPVSILLKTKLDTYILTDLRFLHCWAWNLPTRRKPSDPFLKKILPKGSMLGAFFLLLSWTGRLARWECERVPALASCDYLDLSPAISFIKWSQSKKDQFWLVSQSTELILPAWGEQPVHELCSNAHHQCLEVSFESFHPPACKVVIQKWTRHPHDDDLFTLSKISNGQILELHPETLT